MNRMNDDLRRDSRKDPDQLEREIDATRAELRATLEELEHRLSPRDLLDTVMHRVRSDGGDFAGNLGQRVKDNPVPALLTSIGIAWMMAANGRHHEDYTQSGARRSRMRESAGRMKESASHMRESAGRMKERMRSAKESVKQRGESARHGVDSTRAALSGSAESVRRRARGMSSAARRGAGRARSGVDYLWHEQPLILGAIGLAAGVIAGAALPPTEQEDEAFGKMRDRALDRAKSAGAEGARRARERVEDTARQAQSKLDEIDGHASENQRSGASSERGRYQHQQHPERNHDQRLEPDGSPPSSTSTPGTGLGY